MWDFIIIKIVRYLFNKGEFIMSTSVFIKRHPLLIYYALTFTISWGGILSLVGLDGIPGTTEEFQRMFLIVSLALLAGPSVSGLLLIGLVQGRAGFRELFSRLLRWSVAARWYAVALLTAPVLMTVIPLGISLFFSGFLPGIISNSERSSLLLIGTVAGLMAGILEELGWTGFAIPRLRLRYGALTTGLIVGFLWGAWHLLMNFWTSGDPFGSLSLDLFLHSVLFSAGILPAFRVLMVWVYDRTGSLFVAMLMHFSLTASNVIFVPLATGMSLVVWSLVLAAALWVVVAIFIRRSKDYSYFTG
jgi:membrane protease YdiL (CAAX protease family)